MSVEGAPMITCKACEHQDAGGASAPSHAPTDIAKSSVYYQYIVGMTLEQYP